MRYTRQGGDRRALSQRPANAQNRCGPPGEPVCSDTCCPHHRGAPRARRHVHSCSPKCNVCAGDGCASALGFRGAAWSPLCLSGVLGALALVPLCLERRLHSRATRTQYTTMMLSSAPAVRAQPASFGLRRAQGRRALVPCLASKTFVDHTVESTDKKELVVEVFQNPDEVRIDRIIALSPFAYIRPKRGYERSIASSSCAPLITGGEQAVRDGGARCCREHQGEGRLRPCRPRRIRAQDAQPACEAQEHRLVQDAHVVCGASWGESTIQFG